MFSKKVICSIFGAYMVFSCVIYGPPAHSGNVKGSEICKAVFGEVVNPICAWVKASEVISETYNELNRPVGKGQMGFGCALVQANARGARNAPKGISYHFTAHVKPTSSLGKNMVIRGGTLTVYPNGKFRFGGKLQNNSRHSNWKTYAKVVLSGIDNNGNHVVTPEFSAYLGRMHNGKSQVRNEAGQYMPIFELPTKNAKLGICMYVSRYENDRYNDGNWWSWGWWKKYST